MAEHARRCLSRRAHPTLLTGLMLLATVVVLLQYNCNSNGQTYSLLHNSGVDRLVTRRANSALYKLDVLTPTKERPYTVLTQSTSQSVASIENVTIESLEKSHFVPQEAVLPAAEPKTSHFMAVEPEALETQDTEVYSNFDTKTSDSQTVNGTKSVDKEGSSFIKAMGEVSDLALSEQVVAEEPSNRVETEKVETAKDFDIAGSFAPSGRDLGDDLLLALHHTPSDLIRPVPVSGSDFPQVGKDEQDSEVVELASVESSVADTDVKQKLVEIESEVVHGAGTDALESADNNRERLRHLITNSPSTLSPIATSVEIPVQVQRQETEIPDFTEQIVGSSPLPQASPKPKESKPDTIFHKLQACKQVIDEATRDSADLSLYRGIYKNVAAFSKSYELMEKVFKVYIYRDGRQPLVHTGPQIGIYASEGQFIERMKRASEYLTMDPSQAHMFFLPYSVQHMVENLYVPNSHTMLPLATFIKEYVDSIARRYPFWNRTQGADHFFVSCHDWGPATARDHPTLRTNAMKVVCNADLTEEFVLGKDASLPEVYIHKHRPHRKSVRGSKNSVRSPETVGGPGWDKRPYLAFFAGQMHGRVRPVLLDHWKDKDPDMKIYEVLPKDIARITPYVQHMKMSKYCICAAGYEVNSPRIVEAIYYDCVPVIIADNFVLPFSEVLTWDAFSVTIPESDIPRLKEILNAIPEKDYRSKQVRLRKVRQHFVWHEKPEKYDVFHMILHSIWSSRLDRLEQVRAQSGELF